MIATLLDSQARHGEDMTTIEADTLWTPLVFAAFNTNMIFMEPYTKKLDIYKYELPDLMSRSIDRIHITEQCLAAMTSPV